MTLRLPAFAAALLALDPAEAAEPHFGVWAQSAATCVGHYTSDRPDLLALGPGGLTRWRESCRFAGSGMRAGPWRIETAECPIFEGEGYSFRFSWRLLTDRYLLAAVDDKDPQLWRRCGSDEGWGAAAAEDEVATPDAARAFTIGYVAEAAGACPGVEVDETATKALLADTADVAVEEAAPAATKGAQSARARLAALGEGEARDRFCAGLLAGYGPNGALTPDLLTAR